MSLLCYSPQLDVVVVTTRWRTYRAYCTSVAFPHRQTLSCVRVSYRPGEGCVRVQRAPGWGRDAWARSALPHPEEPETHPTPSTHDPASASPAPSPPADTPPHESTSHHASSFWGELQPQITDEYYHMMHYPCISTLQWFETSLRSVLTGLKIILNVNH